MLVGEEVARKGVRTFLTSTNAFDANEHASINDIVAAVDEILQCHQACQWLTLAVSERSLAQHSLIAVLMDHEMTAAISLGKDRREQWCL